MATEASVHCTVCDQVVADIGPWCRLYISGRYCAPLMALRRKIYDADSIGDGPMVNALCWWIRKNCGDNYVP